MYLSIISGIYLAMLLSPVFYAIHQNLLFSAIWLLSVLIATTFYISTLQRTTRFKIPVFATLLLGSMTIQTLWASVPVAHVLGTSPRYTSTLLYVSIGLFISLMLHTKLENIHTKKFLHYLAYTSVVVSIYAIMQALHLDPFESLLQIQTLTQRSTSWFDRPATAAQWIAICTPLLFITPIKRPALLCALTLNCLAISSTGTRSALLACFIGIGVYFYLQNRALPRRSLMQFGFVAVASLLLLSSRFIYEDFLRSILSRIEILQAAVQSLLKAPWGYGLFGSNYTIQHYISASIYETEPLLSYVDKAHTIVLDAALTLGIQGTVVLLLLIVELLILLFKQSSSNSVIMLSCLVTITVCSLLDFFSVPIVILSWILLGIMMQNVPIKTLYISKNLGLLTLAFLFCLTGSYYIQSTLKISAEYYSFLAKQQTQDAIALDYYKKSLARWPYDIVYYYTPIETAIYSQMYSLADSWIQDAYTLSNHKDAIIYALDGLLQMNTANVTQAQQTFATASNLAPTSIAVKLLELQAEQNTTAPNSQKSTKQELLELLPKEWFTPGSERRRILQKEHPWLEELLLSE